MKNLLSVIIILFSVTSFACNNLINEKLRILDSTETESLCKYEGEVLLIVNVASKCGYTPQYDGLQMVLAAVASGAETATEVKDWLASNAFEGVAMTYLSDGAGNMAHDAVIICYDGASRTPSIKARYGDVDGVLGQAGLK